MSVHPSLCVHLFVCPPVIRLSNCLSLWSICLSVCLSLQEARGYGAIRGSLGTCVGYQLSQGSPIPGEGEGGGGECEGKEGESVLVLSLPPPPLSLSLGRLFSPVPHLLLRLDSQAVEH